MILVTGGRAAGKKEFAGRQFPGRQIVDAYQDRIRAALAAGEDPFAHASALAENENAVILLDEVGCGIVPMEKSEREYRESVGRVGCFLAARAEEVWRVVLGIGTRIK